MSKVCDGGLDHGYYSIKHISQVLNKVLIYKQLADPTRVLFIYFLQVSVSILKQVKHHGQPSLLWSKSSISSKVNFFMQS